MVKRKKQIHDSFQIWVERISWHLFEERIAFVFVFPAFVASALGRKITINSSLFVLWAVKYGVGV